MRTHTYSVSFSHLSTGDWSVAVVQTTLRQGVIVNRTMMMGPVWVSEAALADRVLDAVYQAKRLVRDEQARTPAE